MQHTARNARRARSHRLPFSPPTTRHPPSSLDPPKIVQLHEENNELVLRGGFDHPYPATKVMWAPEPLARERDLLATSGDYLRLWHAAPSMKRQGDFDIKQEAVLNNVRRGTAGVALQSLGEREVWGRDEREHAIGHAMLP